MLHTIYIYIFSSLHRSHLFGRLKTGFARASPIFSVVFFVLYHLNEFLFSCFFFCLTYVFFSFTSKVSFFSFTQPNLYMFFFLLSFSNSISRLNCLLVCLTLCYPFRSFHPFHTEHMFCFYSINLLYRIIQYHSDSSGRITFI